MQATLCILEDEEVDIYSSPHLMFYARMTESFSVCRFWFVMMFCTDGRIHAFMSSPNACLMDSPHYPPPPILHPQDPSELARRT